MATDDSPAVSTSPHRIGYVRVSSPGQNFDTQRDALHQAGCSKIFTDTLSGVRTDRPGWAHLLDYLRPGDTLVVTELSRLTRSLLDLLETTRILKQRRIELVSPREKIDTTSATGRCFLAMMGAIHQMERELRSRTGGCRPCFGQGTGPDRRPPPHRHCKAKLENARILYQNSDQTAAVICNSVGIGRRTFFAYLAEQRRSTSVE